MWAEDGRAHRPEAESGNGKTAAWLAWANNVAGLPDSTGKRPLIRPLRVHPRQHLKKRQRGKGTWAGGGFGAGTDFTRQAVLRHHLCWLTIPCRACSIVPPDEVDFLSGTN